MGSKSKSRTAMICRSISSVLVDPPPVINTGKRARQTRKESPAAWGPGLNVFTCGSRKSERQRSRSTIARRRSRWRAGRDPLWSARQCPQRQPRAGGACACPVRKEVSRRLSGAALPQPDSRAMFTWAEGIGRVDAVPSLRAARAKRPRTNTPISAFSNDLELQPRQAYTVGRLPRASGPAGCC
jgi:hypothetical protein